MKCPPIVTLETVLSTNAHLAQLASGSELPEGYTLASRYQRAGKGQGTNGWESEAGKNLTFSTLLYPRFLKARDQFWLSKAIALSVHDFAGQFIPGTSIKWPNDLYVGEQKISGTLIENILEKDFIRQSVIGIGFNVNQVIFRGGAPNPVSLTQLTGKTYDIPTLLKSFLQCIMHRYAQLKAGEFLSIDREYHESLHKINTLSLFQDAEGIFRGTIKAVTPQGLLSMEKENGKEAFYGFKEVEFLTGCS